MQDYSDLLTAGVMAMATGAMGLIVWLVKRTFSHTIPRLAGDFKESLEKQAEVFQEEIHAQRDFFQDEIRNQRESFREELKLQREDLRIEINRLGERIDLLGDAVRELRKQG